MGAGDWLVKPGDGELEDTDGKFSFQKYLVHLFSRELAGDLRTRIRTMCSQ